MRKVQSLAVIPVALMMLGGCGDDSSSSTDATIVARADQMAAINFTIDEAGTYEVERHITEDVLVIIEAT